MPFCGGGLNDRLLGAEVRDTAGGKTKFDSIDTTLRDLGLNRPRHFSLLPLFCHVATFLVVELHYTLAHHDSNKVTIDVCAD